MSFSVNCRLWVGDLALFNRRLWIIVAAIGVSLAGTRLIAAEDKTSFATVAPVSATDLAMPANANPPSASTSATPIQAATPQRPAAKESAMGKVEEIKPSIFYLPDKEGRLQAVFDFKYEDFVELYKLKRQLDQKEQHPRFTLEKLSADGKADGPRAELTVRAQIALHDADWVRVPLRLEQGLLLEPAEYQGRGEQIVRYLGGEGYEVWLRGPTDSPHIVEFKLLAPVATVGAEHKLKLSMPRAAISELKLAVDENPVAAQGSEGVVVMPPNTAAGGGSEIAARGLGGDFELSWHKTGDANAPAPAVLEAGGSILVRLDDRSISSEAVLTLRSYGSPFDRFTVRLPERAELTSANNTGYTLAPVDAEKESPQNGRLVEVRLPKKVFGPVEIRLSCRRQLDAKNPPSFSDWLDLSGFEVLGAVRQWGVVAAATSADRQILWGNVLGARQIDQLPENLRVQGVAAGFEYSTQPFSLPVRLNPRQTRINVEPEYLIFVDRDRIRLDAKLTYTIHGGKAHSLRIFMPDWDFDRVEPENLLAADGVQTDENGTIDIPLAEPASGTIELRLKAQQSLVPGTSSITVGLPQPQGTASVSALMAVSPAANVELTPDNNASVGLIRQQSALPLKLPERRQEALFYRSEGKAAVFAAEMRVHARKIAVEPTVRVQLGDRAAQVEQKLNYAISFEAVDHLLVDVPQSLAGNSTLKFECDGKPASAKTTASGEDSPPGMSRMRISLPEARLGHCAIALKYSLPLPELQAVKPAVESIPLVVPAEGEMSNNELSLVSVAGIKAAPRGSVWQTADKEPTRVGRLSTRTYRATGYENRLDLEIGKEDVSGANATVVDRAWIQTCWLSAMARQDRAIFQLVTNQNELTLKMPKGAAISQMVAQLDNKRIEVRPIGKDQISISLPGDAELRRCVLEIRYHFAKTPPLESRLKLEFPQIGSGAWNRRLYWQLVLPQGEHVVVDPKGFVSECNWGFMGYFWGRRPTLDQEELETWVDASHRASLPVGLNVYLYSTLGIVEGGELKIAPRALIVLCSSGTVLFIGLLLIYFPRLRHPSALLALAGVLLSLGMIFPEPTILLAQTSSIGLVLAAITAIILRLFPQRSIVGVKSAVVKVEIPSSRSPRAVPPSVPPTAPPTILPPVPLSPQSVSSTQSQPIPPESSEPT
jgi:hypothetical protein